MSHSLIIKTFLFQAIQFSQTIQFHAIQFSINTDFVKCQNSCILINPV